MTIIYFVSRESDVRAGLAQLVEQLIRNEQVEGSSPLASSIGKSRLPRISRESFSLHETRILGLIWALSAEISMPLVKSREC